MTFQETTQRLGPVASAVLAIFLVIVGILVITQPAVLPWLIGIGFVLAGTAFLVGIFVPGRSGGIAHPR